jgi:hypothetical protein
MGNPEDGIGPVGERPTWQAVPRSARPTYGCKSFFWRPAEAGESEGHCELHNFDRASGLRILPGNMPGSRQTYDYYEPGTDTTAFCQSYAKDAIAQNQENLDRNCGYTGGGWHSNYKPHYDWCLTVPPATAQQQTDIRNTMLQNCGKQQPQQPQQQVQQFGGIYTLNEHVPPHPNPCRYPNPFTGTCSCPPGFTSHQIWEWGTCAGGFYTDGMNFSRCLVTMHLCVK